MPSKEGIGSSRTKVKDDCEPMFESWEQNPGHLQEEKELLITEPSLQPKAFYELISPCQ